MEFEELKKELQQIVDKINVLGQFRDNNKDFKALIDNSVVKTILDDLMLLKVTSLFAEYLDINLADLEDLGRSGLTLNPKK